MNPLIIFDYIYYRIAYFYTYRFKRGHTKEMAGITFLSIIHHLNILAILNLEKMFRGNEMLIIFVLLYLIILALNYFRYYKIVKYNELALKWDNENRVMRVIKSTLLICYFILSFLLLGN
jgi:hypothetical protein